MQNPFTAAAGDAAALLKLADRHRLDRALTAPPLRSNAEASLTATFSLLLQLTPAQSRAFVKLVKHDHVSRAELHAAMSRAGAPATDIGIVDVVMTKLRRKLLPHSIGIVTVWGQGYRLSAGDRDKIRALLAAYGGDVIAAAMPPLRRGRGSKARSK